MPYDLLIFDLDGTLSDPKEGITKSFNYALEKLGYEPRCVDELAPLIIGPPLDDSFAQLTQSNDHNHIVDLVTAYRERYAEIGYKENTLYKNITKTIEYFTTQNIRMGVCTSKPEKFARPILEMFNLDHHFEFVSGGELGIKKHHQLADLLKNKAITQNSLMIGDRAVDITSAQKNRLQSAGVLWGYGSHQEINSAKPNHILNTIEELQILNKYCKKQ